MVEDDDQGMGSSAELCVELLLEPVLPVDRDVVVILDNEDVTTGDYDQSLYKTLWCEKYYVKSTGCSLMQLFSCIHTYSPVVYKTSPYTDSSDYMLEETLLTFPPGSNSSSRLCTTLTTIPDAIEESNETVVVHVVPVAPDTTPGGEQRNLTVTIINNDGMLTYAERKHYSCSLFLGTHFKMYMCSYYT